ncbi:MAG: kynureninase [Rhizomicrobium sp.]
MTARIARADLEALDRDDPLRPFRDRFFLPEGTIYLDGNSLGAMPKSVPGRIREVVEEEWGRDLIRSWNTHGWIDLQMTLGAKIGRLIGAGEGETIVADSTSVNLFKVLSAALALNPSRRVILSERENFPTDLYVVEGLIRQLGRGYVLKVAAPKEFPAVIDDDVASVLLTHVSYRTGRMYDMAKITNAAHAKGALMIWDLAHSAGAMPIDLSGVNADFAVGCGYKFLNGGPGAPAFLTIAKRHQDRVAPALSGWFGHAAPFAFEGSFRPADGIARAAVGTPPVLSLAALEVGVDLMLEASLAEVRAKSLRQADVFAALMERELAGHGFSLVSPKDPAQRGSQICFAHEQGWPIIQCLTAHNVIGDFRAPDIVRFGFTPLYLGYAELWDAVAILRRIMEERLWDRPEFHRRMKVT